jgi:hypothetical protein
VSPAFVGELAQGQGLIHEEALQMIETAAADALKSLPTSLSEDEAALNAHNAGDGW